MKDEIKMDYDIRYTVLDSALIFNQCGPMSAGSAGYTKELVEKRKKAADAFIAYMNNHSGFYDKLEASILEEGFRNPILVRSGFSSDRARILRRQKYTGNDKELLICVGGGSSLWIAEKHKMKIPCIISDFMGRFSEEILIEKTMEAVLKYYTDKPKQVTFNSNGVVVTGQRQIHLL